MPSQKSNPVEYVIPSSLGDMQRRKRMSPGSVSVESGELQRKLYDVEQEARRLRFRMIDVEDVVEVVDAIIEEIENDRDSEWSRERVSDLGAKLREARAGMVHRDLPAPAKKKKETGR